MAAPTLAFTPVVTSLVPASGATRAFAGVSIQAGDELRVLAGSESDQNTPSNFRLAAPTNDGAALTWTLDVAVEPSTSGLWAPVYVWRAVGDSTRTLVVTLNRAGSTGTSIGWGGVLLGFRGSGGIGVFTSSNASTGFPSLSLTTTAANSALAMVVGDWSSSSTAGVWTAINGTTPTKDADYGDTTNWGFHVAHVLDAGAAASKTFAMSAPSGQKWAAIAFEVKGTGGGGADATVTTPPLAGVGDVPAPAVAADAAVTAPPVDGTGALPAAAVSGTASVTAPPLDATGGLPAPTVSGTSDATVTAPPLDGTGSLPAADTPISVTVNTGPLSGAGDIPAPSVSGTGDAAITSPPLAAAGDVPAPSVAADAQVAAPPLDAAGDVPAPTVAADAAVTAPPVDGTGALPAPAVSGDTPVTPAFVLSRRIGQAPNTASVLTNDRAAIVTVNDRGAAVLARAANTTTVLARADNGAAVVPKPARLATVLAKPARGATVLARADNGAG